MPTNYPDGLDNFTEPSDPENTPLSSAGSGTRNHTESHVDMGDAIEALQRHASKTTHKHTGTDDSEKLDQANTHEDADTDSGPSAIHHTLGRGANQAAPGNHTHDYENPGDILNVPMLICTTTTRPQDPYPGLVIYERDTNTMRAWGTFPGHDGAEWALLPAANVPFVQVRQSQSQQISHHGTILQWHVEEEDTFGSFDRTVSQYEIVIKESGVYQVDVSISWQQGPIVPNYALMGLVVNGQITSRIVSMEMAPTGLNPRFAQTLNLGTSIRLKVGDRISIRAWHDNALRNILTWTNRTSGEVSRDTRLIVRYTAP